MTNYPGIDVIGLRQFFPGGLGQSPEDRLTPTATGARAEALAQLAGPPNRFLPHKVDQLSEADMKAQTDFVVRIHIDPPEQLRRPHPQANSTFL